MLGFLGPRGFDGLSEELAATLERHLGADDLTTLKALSQRHGVFDRSLVRTLNREPGNDGLITLALGMRLSTVANGLNERGNLKDAEALYLLALTFAPGLTYLHGPLAHLCVLRDDMRTAVEHARKSLASLRELPDQSDPETMEAKVRMGRILIEEWLQKNLGEASLNRARELMGDRELKPEAAQYLGQLGLNIADTETDESLQEYGRFFADTLFDVANTHSVRLGEKLGQADNPLNAMEALAEHGPPALELLWYAVTLFPSHLDAWILAARLQALSNEFGYPAPAPTNAASTALSLLNSLEESDTQTFTKDPRLQGEEKEAVRQFLSDRASLE